MKPYYLLLITVALWLTLSGCARQAKSTQIDLDNFEQQIIGQHSLYFQEDAERLSVQQAMERFASTPVKQGNSPSIALGIGANPAWFSFTLNNPSADPVSLRLAIETPWLDYIDVWLVNDDEVIDQVTGGDHLAYEKRPMPYKVFAFERAYPQGQTQVFIRVETLGPMAVPIKLSSLQAATKDDIGSAYQYGLLYGIMLALALYNFVLYAIIRHRGIWPLQPVPDRFYPQQFVLYRPASRPHYRRFWSLFSRLVG